MAWPRGDPLRGALACRRGCIRAALDQHFAIPGCSRHKALQRGVLDIPLCAATWDDRTRHLEVAEPTAGAANDVTTLLQVVDCPITDVGCVSLGLIDRAAPRDASEDICAPFREGLRSRLRAGIVRRNVDLL